ncbi:MAG TPA: hypothetical protein VF665_21765 [Longimicrobium sp.]|jgi:hypothetical protein|uniref:hypothetical protein n=1 Tax=Longimicrobium sp. TaxID=2029185 RepID=UPI002ED83895
MNKVSLLLIPALLTAARPGAAQGTVYMLAHMTHAPVTFGESVRKPSPAGVERVYIDRNGDIYPRSINIDAGRLRRAGDLETYYSQRGAQAEFDALKFGYGVTHREFRRAWSAVQDALADQVARSVDAPGPLVVLVHGFNSVAAGPGFAGLEARARDADSSVRFLEVYWDGHAGVLTGTAAAWARSRQNAPRVGETLYGILSRLGKRAPIRIVTHSLGGMVAVHAVWSGPYAGRGLPADLRVGMIVPAIAGKDFPARVQPVPAPSQRMVVVGQNEHDYAISKGGLGARYFGSTTLGRTREDFCTIASRTFQQGTRYTVHRLDFSGTPKVFMSLESHDVVHYARLDAARRLFYLLLRDNGSAAGTSCP